MKLLNAIVSAVVIGSAVPLISSAPAVAGCFPRVASSDFGELLKTGTSHNKAMNAVMQDNNYDGSEDCRIKWNMEFWNEHRVKPFNNVPHTPSSKPKKATTRRMSNARACRNIIIAHKPAEDVKVCLH